MQVFSRVGSRSKAKDARAQRLIAWVIGQACVLVIARAPKEALMYRSFLHAMDGVLANQACKCLILRE